MMNLCSHISSWVLLNYLYLHNLLHLLCLCTGEYFVELGIYPINLKYLLIILNMLLPIHILFLYSMNNFDLLHSYRILLNLSHINLALSLRYLSLELLYRHWKCLYNL